MTKKIFAKNIIIGSVVIIAIFGIGLYTNIIKLPITRTISFQYVTDFSDDRKLMGTSHNVFVGKVIRQVGVKERGIGPETQFEVEVIQNIKGNLQGSVVVNQQGGYRNGILYLVYEGDVVLPADNGNFSMDTLFEPGATYLFASRYSERENWYTFVSHPNGRKLISKDKSLNKVQLETLAKNDAKVIKLQDAYKNEILLDVDIKNNNARNSYQSLQKSR